MKDWIGNSKSTFSTLGASSHSKNERGYNDYYATDPKSIKPLFEQESFSATIWEPACGEGHLSKAMKVEGKEVISTDLFFRGYGGGGRDFLKENIGYGCDIITNPPYKYAQEFVEKAINLTGKKVAMFLKITFLEGKKRKKFFEKYPPKTIYVFSYRVNVAKNGLQEEFQKSSAACYAWFVWEKGFIGNPEIKWI